MSLIIDKLRSKLLQWFIENKRNLPWRSKQDPYHIWLSEIIMQQTRVAQGTPYYLKFVSRYPNPAALAAADEQEVLRLWQGLGYYSRARNLHKTARQIVSDYGGTFPDTYEAIIKLKGIGPYTAAAIASIAFNLPYAAIDGNVYRVLARLFGIQTQINTSEAKPIFQKLADDLLDRDNPGRFNEAMMEFGATLCLPKKPLCPDCPLQAECVAFETNQQLELPRKLDLKKVKTRYFHYLLVRDEHYFYLKYRQAGDIWQGLYDLPLVENNQSRLLTKTEAEKVLGSCIITLKPVKKMTHKLTHRTLQIIFYEAGLKEISEILESTTVKTDATGLNQYPLPRPVEIFLNDYLCIEEFS